MSERFCWNSAGLPVAVALEISLFLNSTIATSDLRLPCCSPVILTLPSNVQWLLLKSSRPVTWARSACTRVSPWVMTMSRKDATSPVRSIFEEITSIGSWRAAFDGAGIEFLLIAATCVAAAAAFITNTVAASRATLCNTRFMLGNEGPVDVGFEDQVILLQGGDESRGFELSPGRHDRHGL